MPLRRRQPAHPLSPLAARHVVNQISFYRYVPSSDRPSTSVMVRPLCQIELGILEFRDLRQDYKDGFQRGVVPEREVGHVRRHVTREMTSGDYTSRT